MGMAQHKNQFEMKKRSADFQLFSGHIAQPLPAQQRKNIGANDAYTPHHRYNILASKHKQTSSPSYTHVGNAAAAAHAHVFQEQMSSSSSKRTSSGMFFDKRRESMDNVHSGGNKSGNSPEHHHQPSSLNNSAVSSPKNIRDLLKLRKTGSMVSEGSPNSSQVVSTMINTNIASALPTSSQATAPSSSSAKHFNMEQQQQNMTRPFAPGSAKSSKRVSDPVATAASAVANADRSLASTTNNSSRGTGKNLDYSSVQNPRVGTAGGQNYGLRPSSRKSSVEEVSNATHGTHMSTKTNQTTKRES